jgi:hypothetical protein
MATTEDKRQEHYDEADHCDNHWCDGPQSETLPCFQCFDPDREYSCDRQTTTTATDD